MHNDSPCAVMQGLKIVWDSLEQDQSKKRQHVCVAEDSNVTPEDHVRLLEVYAQSVLSERIKVCEIKYGVN